MRASSSRGSETPTRGNGCLAGVAQSVAQLSCKQQVRGSSPLASSISWPSQGRIPSLGCGSLGSHSGSDRSQIHRNFTCAVPVHA